MKISNNLFSGLVFFTLLVGVGIGITTSSQKIFGLAVISANAYAILHVLQKNHELKEKNKSLAWQNDMLELEKAATAKKTKKQFGMKENISALLIDKECLLKQLDTVDFNIAIEYQILQSQIMQNQEFLRELDKNKTQFLIEEGKE